MFVWMRHRRVLVPLLLVALALGLAACGREVATPAPEATEPPVETIRLPMGYIPNIQYAPFYVAVERGYFPAAGYDIEFDYSFETDGVRLVAAGEVPFAVASGEQVLMARDQGLPVVYVMAWWQKFPVAVIAAQGAGVQEPADLKGQRIGLPGLFGATYIGLTALLHHAGLTEEDVTLEAIGFNQVEALATGQVPVVVGYITNEPIQLRHLGYEVTVLPVADYVALASNGIITSEAMLAEHPDRVRAFVEAFYRGLQDVVNDPDLGYEVSLKFVEGLADQDQGVQMEILRTAIEYWWTGGETPLGHADLDAWRNMNDLLLDMGLISQPQDIEEAVTNQFVP